MSDETDYYGELWQAIREQERICQAIKLIEGLRAIPSEQRALPSACLANLRQLADLNAMETNRRLYHYILNIKRPGDVPTEGR